MTNAGLTSEQTMAGILAMLAAMREDGLAQGKNIEPRKTEVVLSEAGFTAAQIGSMLGKKTDTVHKTIQRSRKGSTQVAAKGDDDAK